MNLALIIISVLPVFLIALYIYNKDKEKEPLKLLFSLLGFGALSCIPAVILELTIENFFPATENMSILVLFIYVFVDIALVEEFCKWFFVKKVTYNNFEFDTIYDIVVYSVFVSLGFAGFENILYVFQGGFSVGILRAFSSVPGHACFSILMGSYLGMAKLCSLKGDVEGEKKNLTLSVLLPVLAHTFFDFCLFSQYLIFYLAFLVFIVVMDVSCIKRVKKLSSNDIKLRRKYNFCSKCGTPVSGKFCRNCGNKTD